MSRVTMAMRKHYLHQEMNNLNEMSKKIHVKLMELHKYAASVSRGFLTPLAMAGMPKSCMALATAFAYEGNIVNKKALERAALLWSRQAVRPAEYNNNQKAIDDAQVLEYNKFLGNVGFMLENPKGYDQTIKGIADENIRNKQVMDDQYMLHMFQEAQKAEQAELRKTKEAEIKVLEDEIQQEKLMVDSRKEAVKNEIAAVEQAEPEAIKRSMSKYA